MAKHRKLKKISTSLGEKHHRIKGGHKKHKMAVKAPGKSGLLKGMHHKKG